MKIILILILVIGFYIFLNCYMNNHNYNNNYNNQENFGVSPDKYLDNEINDKLDEAIKELNDINVIKPIDKNKIYDLTATKITDDQNNPNNLESLYQEREKNQNNKISDLKKKVKSFMDENTFVLPNTEIKINSIKSLQNSQPLTVTSLENGNYLINVNNKCLETNALAKTTLKPCNADNPNQYFSLNTIFNINDYENNLNNDGEKYSIDNTTFKYPFNIVKSIASDNCLTNDNSVLTITPCKPNISQQWSGSKDPILCSYEQV